MVNIFTVFSSKPHLQVTLLTNNKLNLELVKKKLNH